MFYPVNRIQFIFNLLGILKSRFKTLVTTSVFLLTLNNSFVFAQINPGENPEQPAKNYTQSIRGKVIDTDSKSPLIGATVVAIKDDKIMGGAYTGEDGSFRIDQLALGRYTVEARYLGYENFQLPNILLNSGKEVILTIELQEKVILGDTVQIVARERTEVRNEMATVSTRPFTIEETQRYPGSRNDPARMAANFAGVAGANDQRNDLIIRGNSPSGVLWRLEGVDIPNPNHFSTFGTTGGPIGLLNNNHLSNSDFMTGAFPAEYGNAVAGVFDLKMRRGNNEKYEFLTQIGMNGFEVLGEGPFSQKSKASFIAGYRYNNLKLFKLAGISFGSSAVPEFQDFSLKINVPAGKAGTFSLYGLGGLSQAKLLESERTPEDFFGPAGNDIAFKSGMAVGGISHTLLLDETSFTRASLTWSGTSMNVQVDTVDRATFKPGAFYRNYSKQQKWTLSFLYNKKFSVRHTVKAGFFADRIQFDLLDSVYINTYGRWFTPTNFDGAVYQIQPYVQWKYRVTEKITFNSGAHYHHFFFNNTWALEPRAGLKWQLPGRQSLSAGFGLHSQTQPIFVYFTQRENLTTGALRMPNKNLKMTRSYHYVIGYDNLLLKNLRMKVEAYYQDIYGAGIEVGGTPNSFSLLNQGADFWFVVPDSVSNDGRGRNYGLEFTLEKFLSDNYFFLVTASLYDSKYKGSDNIWRNTAFNGHYVVNFVGGADVMFGKKKNWVFGANGKVTIAGGKRYTPIDPVLSAIAEEAVYVDSEAWSLQFKPYFRADLRVSIRWNLKKLSQELAIDISNIFNTKNVLFQIYDVDSNEIRPVNQLGFLPIAQYKIEF